MSGKGGDFERYVSKYLTKWLTGNEKPFMFWRMPGSGSLATIHEENVDLGGDIRAISPEGEFLTNIFCIECKTGYPSTTFWQHFKEVKNFNIKNFWVQCCNESEKHPMLIYRKKGYKPLIGIDVFVYYELLNINNELNKLNNITMRWGNEEIVDMILFSFEDFFKIMKPEDMKKLWQK